MTTTWLLSSTLARLHHAPGARTAPDSADFWLKRGTFGSFHFERPARIERAPGTSRCSGSRSNEIAHGGSRRNDLETNTNRRLGYGR
jgi:hypothetical protein